MIDELFIRDTADNLCQRDELLHMSERELAAFKLGVRQFQLELIRKLRDI
jgi:hypothetical protein